MAEHTRDQSNEKLKRCVDCQHYQVPLFREIARCGHPSVLSPVTGEATVSCAMMRFPGGQCQNGRLFEPKRGTD